MTTLTPATRGTLTQQQVILNMALSKEEEVQRLILLGAISQMNDEERDEIFALKDKLLAILKSATKPEFASIALGLAYAEAQKGD